MGTLVWRHRFGRSLCRKENGRRRIHSRWLLAVADQWQQDQPEGRWQRYDYWVVRIDGQGNKLWERFYGGNGPEPLFDLQPTSDGGFILGGASASPPGGIKTSPNFGSYDFWVVRLDGNGNKLWDKSFGGTQDEEIRSLRQTPDGGFRSEEHTSELQSHSDL